MVHCSNITKIAWVLLLPLFAAMSGCGVNVRQYDLSKEPPFSSYVGKDVALVRDALLVMHTTVATSGPEEASNIYTLVYPSDPGVSLLTKSDRQIILRSGTKVHIDDVRLYSEQHGVLHGFFHIAQLKSSVKIKVDAQDWPQSVSAVFDHATNQGATLAFGSFNGKIRPAPWEPLDTPAERATGWPDDKYLVPSDKGR